jgi:gliding motility-associated-like protein
MKNFGILLLAVLSVVSLNAQEISIAAYDDYTSCEGAIVDSGLSAADYGANEYQTITWCPEAPETVLNLYWVVFDLDPASQLSIYDGPDTTAPLMGSYTGDEIQGMDIFSGASNVTGCLTIEFTSGASSTGNFGAYASCGYPCERPFAIVNPTQAQPLLACLNEPVYLESMSSTVADGQELVSWVWDLGDGNMDSTSGPNIEHSYSEPGLYIMNLELTDDNDCSNNNVLDYQILVSTDPTWVGTSTDLTMCVGDEVDITGAVQGVLYNAEPSVDLGGGLFIPDDQGECFSSEINLSSFSAGAIVQDANVDIVNAFINFEHSFMGDLTITFTCPNGQTVQVHQQGGGGTALGEPIDDDANLEPGIGYDYYWSPTATNGTWADNATATLPSGTYESVQPFTNLNGCPLNGIWEIEVCDLWASDNGFIFDWSLSFDPSLYPEAVSFTPTFGPECDSTWWDGPSIINDGGDCNTVTVSPTFPGVETYTYRARNDFGCLYERSLDVTAVGLNPTITATPAQYCGDPVTLFTDLQDVNANDCEFLWSPASFLNHADWQNPTINHIDSPTEFTVTVTYDYPLIDELVCTNSFTIEINTCEITIPNVFTPNNDGDNDRWLIDGLDAFSGSKLYIYNRWGNLVWSHIDFGTSAGWDPGLDGASAGLYYYVLEINAGGGDVIIYDEDTNPVDGETYPDAGVVTRTGSFTLLR